MKVFVTRVWGFDPAFWPVIPFGLEGNRDKLLRDSEIGDRVAFVGTLREPTPEKLRGRLLGMAEIRRRAVDTLDIITEDVRGSHDFDEHGRFRWPKALLLTRAWHFEPQPRLLDVLSEQLPYHATSQAVELSAQDATAVMALNLIEVQLPVTEALSQARLLEKALSAGRPTTGPKPTSWMGSAGRDVNRQAFTYALRFGKTDVWKIGHAVDVRSRLDEVNKHVPTEVVAERWEAIWSHRWKTEVDAHGMEQRVLKALEKHRTEGERVWCPQATVWSAWTAAIGL